MKQGVVIGLGIAALLLFMSMSSNNTEVDLSSLNDSYGADKVARLQTLLNALSGRGLTHQQILFLLSQALVETGLFNDYYNANAVENDNNYAGLSSGGSLVVYPTVSAFVDAWLSPVYLDKGSYPLQATSIDDYAVRLKTNGYFTDDLYTYQYNLEQYYNLLSGL
jgi:hypothetical protein